MMTTNKRLTRTGGGLFDPGEENVYFIAANPDTLQYAEPVNNHLLVAVNELEGETSMGFLREWCADKKKVFLDSRRLQPGNELCAYPQGEHGYWSCDRPGRDGRLR